MFMNFLQATTGPSTPGTPSPSDLQYSDALHGLENYYTFTKWDAVALGIIALLGLILVMTRRSPTVGGFRDFVGVINSRGGNILVLLMLTIYFFSATMRLFYHAFALISAKQLDSQNAILLMGLQFVTSSAFGGSFASMLKTMTGSDGMTRTSDAGGAPLPPADTKVAPISAPTGPAGRSLAAPALSTAPTVEEVKEEAAKPV